MVSSRLELTDRERHEQVAAEALDVEGSDGAVDALRAEFLERASHALDDFLADSDEIVRKTRGQVVRVLDDLQQVIDGGMDQAGVISKIEGYRADLMRAGTA